MTNVPSNPHDLHHPRPRRRCVTLPSLVLHTLTLMLLLLFVTPAAAEDGGGYDYDVAVEEEEIEKGYIDLTDVDLDGMSIMPVSCVNYKNGNMIKFQMFRGNYNFQCHANSVGTYVVSISHFMRVRFNYLSLVMGEDFTLPEDVGYLNCVQLRQTSNSDTKLYARIGCQDRSTYTSTHLSLHLYTDKKCTAPYDDGRTAKQHRTDGYLVDDRSFETAVSFRPDFYSCRSCKPRSVSKSFSRSGTVWYDDDAEAKYRYFDDWLDDYVWNDDAYAAVQEYVNNEQRYDKDDDDDFYTVDDDGDDGDGDGEGGRRLGTMVAKAKSRFTPVEGELEKFEKEFYESRRRLEDAASMDDALDDKIQSWDMCTNLYKYSLYCSSSCRAADNSRLDEWSSPDLLLLSLLLAFLTSTMGLVLYNKKAEYEKAAMFGEEGKEVPDVGMPTNVVAVAFLVGLGCVVAAAGMRLVNLSLVLAAVGCVVVLGVLVNMTFFKGDSGGGGKGEGLTVQQTPYSLT